MIEKRLSAERQIPASTQKKEIVEEIITIKRQSLIDDTRAKHEEEILMQKPIDNSYKTSTNLPDPVVKLKTTHLKDGSDVSKKEFDKELQDKFKTTLKDVENFEHKFVTDDSKITETIVQQTQVFTTNIVDLKQKESKISELTTDVIKDYPDKIEKSTKAFITEERFKSQIPVSTKTTLITKQTNDKTTKFQTEQSKKYQEEVKEKSDSVVTVTQHVSSATSHEPDVTSTFSMQKEKIETSTKLVDDIIEQATTVVDQTKTKTYGAASSVIDTTITKISETAAMVDKTSTQISEKVTTEFIEAETIGEHQRRTIEETFSEKFMEESKIMERKFMEFGEDLTTKTHSFSEQLGN
jgi:hypothetical protein